MSVRLRFRHVETFRAAMLTGSITGAAAKLHVTQPAVSHLINEMEGMLGFSLFDRRGGRVVPTSNGELLFFEIERCFLGLDHINDFAGRVKRAPRKTVMVAAVPVISVALLARAVKCYRETVAPDFFSINSRISEQVVGWVSSQKVDIGFALATEPVPGIHTEPIVEVRLLCALPKTHRLARKAEVSVEDLANEPFIAMSKSEGVRSLVEDLFSTHHVEPQYIAECPMTTAACAMVDAGVGLTLLEPFAASPLRLANVVFRPFVPAVPITFSAFWLKSQAPHFARDRLVEIVKDVARSVAASFDPAAKVGYTTA
jgi:DNA-binding transcriptional LysR family regulator